MLRAFETVTPPDEPYFRDGLWAREGGVFFHWCLDIAKRRNPAAKSVTLIQDGVAIGGFVRAE